MSNATVWLWRLWLRGNNTYEIALASGRPEHEVDRILAACRNAVYEHKKGRRKPAPDKAKRGFTGRETVAGYARGRV